VKPEIAAKHSPIKSRFKVKRTAIACFAFLFSAVLTLITKEQRIDCFAATYLLEDISASK